MQAKIITTYSIHRTAYYVTGAADSDMNRAMPFLFSQDVQGNREDSH